MRAFAVVACLLGCVGHMAHAFVSPVGLGTAVQGTRGLTMKASEARTAAVSVYKNYLGKKKWEANPKAEANAQKVFDAVESIYGQDNALTMVKAVPACLGYDTTDFKATFDAFSETFGAEETVGMVTRNPTLMAVRPTGFGGACNAKDDTMFFSYVIAYTRPLGPVLLAILGLCIATPFVEAATGMSRVQLLQMVFPSA